MFAFVRGFVEANGTSKFYSAAQTGVLTGTAPFTFGSLFSIQSIQDASGAIGTSPQTIFGNAVFGTSGFGHRQTAPGATGGKLEAAQGIIQQVFGTSEAAPGPTYNPTPEAALLGQWRSHLRGELSPGGAATAEFPTVKPNQVVFLITVVDGSNQLTYVNGQLAASVVRSTVTNTNVVGLGARAGGSDAAEEIDIAGCFYHSTAMTELQVKSMVQAAMQAEDIVNPVNLDSGALNPDHIWSVKRGNPDGRANWFSSGAAATPIAMVRTGTFVDNDFYGANRAWYSAGA